jgi:hypothetical protein
MQSVFSSASPSSPQSSGAMFSDVQQRSPRATLTHVQRQCDMGLRGPSPCHSVPVTVIATHPESRVESSALIPSSSPRIHKLHTLQPAQPEGPLSSPLSTIPPNQFNYQFNSEHVRAIPLNGFQQAPASEQSSVYPTGPQLSHESPALSPHSSPFHDALNLIAQRPRAYHQVFHTASDLAAHHGIPQSLPPPPRTTPRRSSEPEPEPIPDFSLSSLCSNYLTMLASSKHAEQISNTEGNTTAGLPMSVDNEAAAQAIASALSGSPDFVPLHASSLSGQSSSASSDQFNPSDFLTSPMSPWEDLLTTPAVDADVGMTSDIYTSPVVFGFPGDFDNMPSLFGSTGYEDYDDKVSAPNSLPPSDLPLPDMDDMYKISPGTPAIDTPSLQSSPIHVDHSSAIPTRRKTVPTGTRKNITPESLVPYEAPIQSRKYRLPSSTSRKELPATFARKRARTQAPDEGEGEGEDHPTLSEEDAIKVKRLQNTLAARRSRKRKLEYQRELEDAIEAERKDKEMWRERALVLEALLRDKGHEVPRMNEP